MWHVPSSTVAVESKLVAPGALQPRTPTKHAPSTSDVAATVRTRDEAAARGRRRVGEALRGQRCAGGKVGGGAIHAATRRKGARALVVPVGERVVTHGGRRHAPLPPAAGRHGRHERHRRRVVADLCRLDLHVERGGGGGRACEAEQRRRDRSQLWRGLCEGGSGHHRAGRGRDIDQRRRGQADAGGDAGGEGVGIEVGELAGDGRDEGDADLHARLGHVDGGVVVGEFGLRAPAGGCKGCEGLQGV
eukprot:scaffold107726_cov60-Phaeocystis_antarctica.AAC.2